MIAINNSGLLNICNNCANGLVPTLSWSYDANAKLLTIADKSVFKSDDGLDVINIEVHDKHGNVKHEQIQSAGDSIEIDLNSGFKLNEGFNITATIVTEKRNTADLAIYLSTALTQTSGNVGVEIENVVVTPVTSSIEQGDSQQLEASVLPEVVNQGVTWAIAPSATGLSVVNGLVKTTATTPVGEYTVTATSTANTAIKGSAKVTVTEA